MDFIWIDYDNIRLLLVCDAVLYSSDDVKYSSDVVSDVVTTTDAVM